MAFNATFKLPFPDFTLDVDLTLPTQGVTVLFGPSGSGKTSLLRAIAGLVRPPGGHLTFRDQVWQSEKIFIPTHKRPIGYVFQESSLFDHLTVQQNLIYAVKRAYKPARAVLDHTNYHYIIELLDISHLRHRRPDQLSGGERQRVALARALVRKPALLLMDEPMASLDYGRKKEILTFLEHVKSELEVPLIYVSHNVDEVTRLADHLVVLDQGRVEVQGPIEQVLSQHKILNRMRDEPFTLLFGQVIIPRTVHHLTEVDIGDALIRMPQQDVKMGQKIRLHLYAKDVSLTLIPPKETSVLNIIDCRIDRIDPVPNDGQCLIHLTRQETRFKALISTYSCEALNLKPGRKVFAQIKAVSLVQ